MMAADNKLITYYHEAEQFSKKTLRDHARHLALNGLSVVAREKHLAMPRVQFLYIHHIFKDEEKKLDALLKRLSKHHEFISYSAAVDKVASGQIDKPYITFSSDDGFQNNLVAAEILNEYNAKSCFFINPGIIGEKSFDKINKYCKETLRFPPVAFLDWDEVARIQQLGHEIGSHTMMHMNIADASAGQITDDMHQTFRILNQRCGSVQHFAYPYGRFFHFSSTGRKAAIAAGFKSCATAERGCHISSGKQVSTTDLCIRRDHTVLGWNMKHILYFLINNAKNANVHNNSFPDSLK